MSQFTSEEKEKLFALVKAQRPPTLAMSGVSGSGKSSFLNQSFRTKLPISHTKACTKEFWRLELEVVANQGELKNFPLRLGVRDAPGWGEDLAKDGEYLEMYEKELPECDVVVHLMSARNRAVSLDQFFLEKIRRLCPNIVVGLGQVDLVEPMNWPPHLPIPSREQEQHIKEIIEDRTEKLRPVLGYSPTIIPLASKRGYNLETMFTAILQAAPKGRKWLFDLIKGYRLEDWLPNSVLRGGKEVRTEDVVRDPNTRESRDLLRHVKAKLKEVFGPGSERELSLKLGELLGREHTDPERMSSAELREIEKRLAQEQVRRAH